MAVIAARLAWYFVAALGLSYGSFLTAGSVFQSSKNAQEHPVEIIDQLKPGVHQLAGTITVPTNCHELSVRVNNTAPNTYTLEFETWEEPSIPCSHDPVTRRFGATAFAPAVGVKFDAQLDGVPIAIIVHPKVVWEKSTTSDAIIQRLAQ